VAKEWRSVCGVAAVEMPAEAVDEDHIGFALGVFTACDFVQWAQSSASFRGAIGCRGSSIMD
jgi:hypothetical protein